MSQTARVQSLRSRADFRRIYRQGERLSRGGVVVIVAPGETGKTRVGVVAGKRIGSAVRRNRAKRRIREALRRVPLEEGKDYVVIASTAVNEAPFSTLVEWLTEASSHG